MRTNSIKISARLTFLSLFALSACSSWNHAGYSIEDWSISYYRGWMMGGENNLIRVNGQMLNNGRVFTYMEDNFEWKNYCFYNMQKNTFCGEFTCEKGEVIYDYCGNSNGARYYTCSDTCRSFDVIATPMAFLYEHRSKDTSYTVRIVETHDVCGMILQYGLSSPNNDVNLIHFGNRELWFRLFAFPLAVQEGMHIPTEAYFARCTYNYFPPKPTYERTAKYQYSSSIDFIDPFCTVLQMEDVDEYIDSAMTRFTTDFYCKLIRREDIDQIISAYFELILSKEEAKIMSVDLVEHQIMLTLSGQPYKIKYDSKEPYFFKLKQA